MNLKIWMIISLLLVSATSPALADGKSDVKEVHLHIFYGQGCPHCAKAMAFLDGLESKYPALKVHKHEIYFDEQERGLFIDISKRFNKEVEGVPTVFIGSEVIVGFSDLIATQIEQEINTCLNSGCEDPLDEPVDDPETDLGAGNSSFTEDPSGTEFRQSITLPAVISAAAVDAINPCAFAVLIILLTTVLASKNKKRALLSGFAFSISIFISYFLMGIGLYSAIQATGLSHSFYAFVAILAIFIGLFNLKDYLWYGKWFVMEVPMSWRPRLQAVVKGVTSVPGAFVVGFLVSLFLLPCTSGPYIVILGLLSKIATRDYAIMLLVLYNLVFVMPMVLITLAIYFGITTTEQAEKLRQKKLRILHLIAGIIILCLGIGMLVAMQLKLI